jgi:hypothetical protein
MTKDKQHRRITNDLILGALAGKVSETSEIAKSTKSLIRVEPGTLYFPVISDAKEIGGVFLGKGQFIVDAIVETRKGAFGSSIEHPWDGSLLILGKAGEWTPPSVIPAKDKDFKTYDFKSEEEARNRAKQILDGYINRDFCWKDRILPWPPRGWMVSILDTTRGPTHIIAKDSHLIFKDSEAKIVLSGNHLVEKRGRKKTVVTGRWGPIIRIR